MGSPNKTLRLVHIEDVATAVVKIVNNETTKGKVFVLSSPERIRLRDYIDRYVKHAGGYQRARVLFVRPWFANLSVTALMVLKKVTRQGPNLNFRRIASIYRDLTVNCERLKTTLNWEPQLGLLDRLMAEERCRPRS
jgi:nucleoside-diphosphate-sugar epimerase